jgi:hypothetical protein
MKQRTSSPDLDLVLALRQAAIDYIAARIKLRQAFRGLGLKELHFGGWVMTETGILEHRPYVFHGKFVPSNSYVLVWPDEFFITDDVAIERWRQFASSTAGGSHGNTDPQADLHPRPTREDADSASDHGRRGGWF